MNDSTGHYYCNQTSDSTICHPLWFRNICTKYCKENNDILGHYLCEQTTGSKICHSGLEVIAQPFAHRKMTLQCIMPVIW